MTNVDEHTAAAPSGPDDDSAVAAAPASADSVGQYLRAAWVRLRSGDSGVLPVVVGMVVLAIIFQILNSHFLTAGNLVNLLDQGAVYMVLGLGIVFVLLLGEIDLSIGWVATLCGTVMAEMVQGNHPAHWWVAVLCAVLAGGAIGLLQGSLITLLGLPSFVVTLAGFLAWEGMQLVLLGNGGAVPIHTNVINDLANGNLTTTVGWIITIVLVVGYGAAKLIGDARRRARGLTAPPLPISIAKVAIVAAAGVVVILICNANRGLLVSIEGAPWVLLIVLVAAAICSLILGRLRFGRYVYAIGGNAEAARRAGINLTLMRTAVFGIAGLLAGLAGVLYASRLQGISTTSDGSQLVLYCIAAAVIGGTSLFGGRGKAVHAILGGLVIAAIANGMGLLGLSAAAQDVVTAVVLLAAVTVDALARRGRTRAGVV